MSVGEPRVQRPHRHLHREPEEQAGEDPSGERQGAQHRGLLDQLGDREAHLGAGVDREEVEKHTADFSRECFEGQLDLWTHIGNVLAAMQENAALLELDGRLAAGKQA